MMVGPVARGQAFGGCSAHFEIHRRYHGVDIDQVGEIFRTHVRLFPCDKRVRTHACLDGLAHASTERCVVGGRGRAERGDHHLRQQVLGYPRGPGRIQRDPLYALEQVGPGRFCVGPDRDGEICMVCDHVGCGSGMKCTHGHQRGFQR